MSEIGKMDAQLEEKLNLLTEVPSRNHQKMEIGKKKLLSTAKYYQRPVSKSQNLRLKDRFSLKGLFSRKEPIPMLTQILAAILVVTGLVGGTGVGTAFASQYSMPGDALYPVKLWTEDVRMDLAGDEETAFELDLVFADRRMDEMVTLLGEGEEVPEEVLSQFQGYIDDALTKSVGLEDPAKAMDQLQDKLQVHQEQMDQLKVQSQTMEQTKQMVQERLQVIEKVQQQTATKDQLRLDQPEDRGPDDSNGNSENGSQNFCEGDAECAGQGTGAGQGDGTGQGEDAGSGQGNGAGPDGEPGQGQQPDETGGQQQGGQGLIDGETQGYGTQGTGGQGSGGQGSGGYGGGHN
jgi:hypothetical protein